LPQGPIKYPTLGSVLGKELGSKDSELPSFVAVAPNRLLSPGAYGAGFLGPQYAPFIVGDPGFNQRPNMQAQDALSVRNIELPEGIDVAQADARLALLGTLETGFQQQRPGLPVQSHRTAYDKAVKMMRSTAVKAFNLDEEPAELREAYGRNAFGDACLLARRLVERGVAFVEVSLNGVEGSPGIGWDTHQDNFTQVKNLCGTLDPAWATLLEDLKTRGLLETTLVVWMGEFGRTPQIAAERTGRDHFPNAWSTVLCGGGIRGGQVIGRTKDDGMDVDERPVGTADFIATMCLALGIDPRTQNDSNVGRPIRIADPTAQPVHDVVAGA
jgi:hypothetical protein